MKKIIIFLLISVSTFAQWGLYIGGNQAYVSSSGTDSETEDFSSSLGFEFGVSYDYELKDKLWLVTGLSYQILKSEVSDSDSPTIVGDLTFSYIQVSPKLYYFTENNIILIAGLGYGFNTRADMEVGSVTIDYDKLSNYDVNNMFSVSFGFGYDTTLNDLRVRPRVTYTLSLNDQVEENTSSYSAKANVLNFGLDIML